MRKGTDADRDREMERETERDTEQAEFILLSVERLLEKYRGAGQAVRHLALVAHSLGGLSVLRAVSLQQHLRRGGAQVDLRDVPLLSLFLVNCPVGGHQLLERVPSFAWLYRQLHADMARVLGFTHSGNLTEQQELQQAMLLPRTIGIYSVSSGHQDALVLESIAGLPVQTLELSPAFLWARTVLSLSKRRLLEQQQQQQQHFPNSVSSSSSSSKDVDGWGCLGLKNAAGCGMLTTHVFYRRVSLPLSAGVHASSCHDCPLLSRPELKTVVQLLQAQASLAEQLLSSTTTVNAFLTRRDMSQGQQQEHHLVQQQIDAIDAALTAGDLMLHFVRLRIPRILDSGLQALHPAWRLKKQQDSLLQVPTAAKIEQTRSLLRHSSLDERSLLQGAAPSPDGLRALARRGLCSSSSVTKSCLPQRDSLAILFTAHKKGLGRGGIKAVSPEAAFGANGDTSQAAAPKGDTFHDAEENLCWAAAAHLQQPLRMRLALPLLQQHLLRLRYDLAGDGEKAEKLPADELEREGLLLQTANSLTRSKLLGMLPVAPDRLLPLPVKTQRLLHEALLASFSSSNSMSSTQGESCLQEALREGRSKFCGPFVVYPVNLQPLMLQGVAETPTAGAAAGESGKRPALPRPRPLPVVSLQPRPSFASSRYFFSDFFDGRNTTPCDLRPLALPAQMQKQQQQQQQQQQPGPAYHRQQQHLHAALLAQIAAAMAARVDAKGEGSTPEDRAASAEAAATAAAAKKETVGEQTEFLPRGLLLLAVEHPAAEAVHQLKGKQPLSIAKGFYAAAARDAAAGAAEFGMDECSSPELLEHVLREVNVGSAAAVAAAAAARNNMAEERRFCFFALQPDIQTDHPLRSCGWTFDAWEAFLGLISTPQQQQKEIPRAFLLAVDVGQLGSPHAPMDRDGFREWAAASEQQQQQQQQLEDWESAPTIEFSNKWVARLADWSLLFRLLASLFVPMKASLAASPVTASRHPSGSSGSLKTAAAALTAVATNAGKIENPLLLWVPHSQPWGHLMPLDISVAVRPKDSSNSSSSSNGIVPFWLPSHSAPDFVWLAAWPSSGDWGVALRRVSVDKTEFLSSASRAAVSAAAFEAKGRSATVPAPAAAITEAGDAATTAGHGVGGSAATVSGASGLSLLQQLLETPVAESPHLQELLSVASACGKSPDGDSKEPEALLAWLRGMLELRDMEASSRVLALRLSPVSFAKDGNPQSPLLSLRNPNGHFAAPLMAFPLVSPTNETTPEAATVTAATSAAATSVPVIHKRIREAQLALNAAERRLDEKLQTHVPLLLLQDVHLHVPAAAYLADSNSNNSNSSSSSSSGMSFEFVLEARVNWLAFFRSFFVEYFALFLGGLTANAALLLGLVCLFLFHNFRLIKNHAHRLHEQQQEQQQQAAALAIAPASHIGCKQKTQLRVLGKLLSCADASGRRLFAIWEAAAAVAADSVFQHTSYPFGIVWGRAAGWAVYLAFLCFSGTLYHNLQPELLQQLSFLGPLLFIPDAFSTFVAPALPIPLLLLLLFCSSLALVFAARLVLLLLLCLQHLWLPPNHHRKKAAKGAGQRLLRSFCSVRALLSRCPSDWWRRPYNAYSRNKHFISLRFSSSVAASAAAEAAFDMKWGVCDPPVSAASSPRQALVQAQETLPAERFPTPPADDSSASSSEGSSDRLPHSFLEANGCSSSTWDGCTDLTLQNARLRSPDTAAAAGGEAATAPAAAPPPAAAAAPAAESPVSSFEEAAPRMRKKRRCWGFSWHAKYFGSFFGGALLLAAALFPYRIVVLLLPVIWALFFIECTRCGASLQGLHCPYDPQESGSRCRSEPRRQGRRAVDWSLREAPEGCLIAVYAQPFCLLLQLFLCSGYAVMRSLNIHLQTEQGKSLLAGRDGTIAHLLPTSRLAAPSLMDAALPVLALRTSRWLPAFLRQLLPASLTSRGSWGLTQTQDDFALAFFCCLLPLCFFARQRVARIAAACRCSRFLRAVALQHSLSQNANNSWHTCSRSSTSYSYQKRLWISGSRMGSPDSCLRRLSVCAAVQLTLAVFFVALTRSTPIAATVCLAGSVALQVIVCPL